MTDAARGTGPLDPTTQRRPAPADLPYAGRIARLRSIVASLGGDRALVSEPALVRHHTGVRATGGPVWLLVTEAGVAVGAPDGEAEADALEDIGIELVPYPAYEPGRFRHPATEALTAARATLARSGGRLAIDAPSAPAGLVGDLASPPLDLSTALLADRPHKDTAEIAAIRRSVEVVERCLAAAIEACRPGATERDLDVAMREVLWAAAGEDATPAWNVGGGPRAALPDPHASDRRLEPGDSVLLDVYPTVHGHVADLCRTIVVGEPDRALIADHAAVRVALEAGRDRLRPGTLARDVDTAIREALASAVGPRAASMQHHAGHGLGILAWEPPWIGVGEEATLVRGSVLALEPGLYRDDGGLRLEGMWLVTDQGPERLDQLGDALVAAT